MTRTRTQLDQNLADRLRTLTRDFHFTWGQPASCSDGEVDVSIDRDWDEDGEVEHLITVFAGFPPGPEVAGLTLTLENVASTSPPLSFTTDRRGQVRLQGLEPAEYRVRFEPAMIVGPPIVLPFAKARVDAGFFRKTGSDPQTRPVQRFDAAEGRINATLIATPANRIALRVEIAQEAALDRLARFRILDAEDQVLTQGFTGLIDVGEGKVFGELLVDVFDPEFRKRGMGIQLEVQPHGVQQVTVADRDLLEQSLAATAHPNCKEVLKEILKSLPFGPSTAEE